MKKRLLSVLLCLFVVLTMSAAKQPKYIFYFIGDGMGLSPVLCSETYNRTVLGNDKPLIFMQFPTVSYATSYSANNTITDSAAAGTALSTGHKTNNSMLGLSPDKQPVTSIAAELKEQGYGIAIATTVDPDDATPAAFYAHVEKRSMFYEIAQDMAASGYDLFAGGRLRGKTPEGGKDVKTILSEAGYTVVNGPQGFEANKNRDKLVLLSTTEKLDHVGYAIDYQPGALTLPFITQACIEHEMRVSPDKFFIMIEGGLIDHSLHANDAATTVKEVLDFEKSIRIAYEFYLQHPKETLILVTADHNTGGMAAGVSGGPYNLPLKNIDYQKISIETMQADCRAMVESGKIMSWDEMKAYLEKNFGLYGAITVSEKNDKLLQDAYNATFVAKNAEDNRTLYASLSSFVQTTYDVLDKITGIGWTTNGHTGDFVPVYAIGVGSELFEGFHDNTDLPNIIRKTCKIPTHSSK